MHKRLSLEMGGKNAQIVMDDADLDLALEGVLWGAFGTTGQRCTATSRLILQRGVHDTFLEQLTDRVQALRLGDGRHQGTDVGPLIHAASRAKVEEYVEIGHAEGARLVTGGRPATTGARLVDSSSSRRSLPTSAPSADWSRRRFSGRSWPSSRSRASTRRSR